MSSPHSPSDCTLQVPSWDEFDRSEELDYNSDSERESEEQYAHSRNFDPVAPPGFDAATNQGRINASEVRHSQSNSSLSYFDQLPNSVNEASISSSTGQQLYGPSLPPGFVTSSEEDDPEDPGDPEDPDEGDSQSAMPNMNCISQLSTVGNLAPSSSQAATFGPTVPSSSDLFSPSLPEEETKRSCESSLLPPPEPGETHSSSVSCPPKRLIGPAMPDLLPAVASSGYGDEEGTKRDVYGPAVPFGLQNKPSTSGRRDFDVEVPVDDDTCGRYNEGDNNEAFGPIPPWEQKADADDDYTERLLRLETQQASRAAGSKRPEWMTQPPKRLSGYGLTAKTFSRMNDSTASEEARREWTETPDERKKRLEQGELSSAGPSGLSLEPESEMNADAAHAECAATLENRREEPLLDTHQRKRKRGADENGTDLPARRPFDRERDMDSHGIRRVGNLSAEAIKERCGQLSSRFAPSTSRKFL